MNVGNRSTHIGTETANQRGRSTFENGDLVVELSSNRRNFEANETGTDHDNPLAAFGNLLPDAERIVKCSQYVDVLVAALVRQTTRYGSCGDDQPVEGARGTVAQVDLLVGWPES